MRLIALLVASILLVGCGGGSGGGGGSQPLIAVPQTAGEGTLEFDGTQVGGTEEHVLTQGRRTMLAFDLAPFTQPVSQATLRFVSTLVFVEPPGVELTLSHIDGGGLLDIADYGSAAFSTNGPLAPITEHVIDVTMWVNLDIAVSRPTSTFRLSLEQTVESVRPIEFPIAGSAYADAAVRPTLTITQ